MSIDNSLSKLIARKIATDIFSGQLCPEERVTEDVYALQFGTSRAPVREALYLLSTEGLIERKPRRGAFVKKYKKQEIKDLFELRLTLEFMSIDRVKGHILQKEKKKMEEILSNMNAAIETRELGKYTELNSEFHIQIIELSKSEVYKTIYKQLGSPLIALQDISFKDKEKVQSSFNDHIIIWNLLLEGELSGAKDVLKKHNKSVLERISNDLK